ncbi:uncharacterized protein LOC110853464 [Folsomia candida]|uniref:CHK kinase-like domain-containing protein n=1 Tax=Folsomia candida TaxID=158441 RepID=A0A226E1P9_FOLCA|nr:uncharacterized protein LOC110853464 [Folsomia candida]OXA51218.1 hypothetical protein Fcan01_14524 [Folsomia candida]
MSPTPEVATSEPNCNDLITKEFLQNVLKMEAKGGPVAEIISHYATLGTKPGDNYMSVIYSVDVDLSDGTKRYLLIKCYPSHPARQEMTNKMNMFFKECEVYSKWMPELRRMQNEVLNLDKEEAVKLPYAKFVHGECIDFQSEAGEARIGGTITSLDNYIIMEDLRKTYGFRMTDRREPLDLDHMKLVITALARVHSVGWAYRHHVEADIVGHFPCLVGNVKEEDIGIWNKLLIANIDQAKGVYDEAFGPENNYSAAAESFKKHVDTASKIVIGKGQFEGMEKLFRVTEPDPDKFGKDVKNPEPWRIICHGDCWSNNMLFRYDPATGKPLEIVLVDLQMPRETCVVNDLEYVFHVCTTLALRRAHLDDLLQLYHDTFNGVCAKLRTPTLPGFCMDSLRYRFHRGKFFGYYMAMMGIPLMMNDAEVSNLEDMDEDKEIGEAISEMIADVRGSPRIKDRLIQVTKGMMEDGVL